MTSLKAQTDAKIEESRQANPDFMSGVEDVLKQAKEFQQGRHAINIGEKAPVFELPNPENTLVSLESVIRNGPVIITFYRGSWCPYCNLQLKAMQARIAEIKENGAQLIAISPQIPDGSMTKNAIREMDFTVLSDQDAKIAASYGVSWEVPEFLGEHMKVDRGLNLEALNNGNGSILPIPATFVLNKDGIVVWRYVDVDYRTRAEPDEIIQALKNL